MKIWKKLTAFTFFLIVSFYLSPHINGAKAAESYTLTVMHVNDSHSHDEQYPKLTTAVNEVRKTYPNALLLHAGDVFYGTSYYTTFLGQADIWFMNNIKYDAMTLGNHEFDNGTSVLSDFIKNLNFPVISSNVNGSGDSALGSLSVNNISSDPSGGKIYPAIIKEVNGEKIGIFGLLTTESKYTYPVPAADPFVTAQATVDALKQQGINKIIALTHLGYDVDKTLAKTVNGIDIIVGGHTHTVLSNPVVIQNTEPTVIVQAGSFLDYLGLLNITFDTNGVVIAQNGRLLAVNNYTPDPTAQAALDQLNSGILPSSDPSIKNGWIIDNGNTYFYVNGMMQIGWKTVLNNTYYFGTDGVMQTGWQTIAGNRYYFGTDGAMRKGWQTIDGNTYYFGTDTGIMKTGWYTINGVAYNFGTDGILLTYEWKADGGNTYLYLNGVMQTGWQTISGKTYYFGADGVMRTGWQTISGNKYYFGADGVMRKGWQTIDGNTYYFGTDSGIMKTGWYTINGVAYNFGSDGVLITYEWKVDGGNTYLFANGVMQTGWQKVGGNTYYFGSDGIMRTYWQTISGNSYYFGADGTMRKGWQTIDGYKYYFGSDSGIMKTGNYTINGVTYNFGTDGKLIS